MARLLFHYTSLEAFIEIMTSGHLWASNIHYLNDGREFGHAVSLLNESLDKAMRERDETRDFLELVRGEVEAIAEIDVFVGSFSEEGDLLSQWRAYCPAARGVSIGIEEDLLRKACEAQKFSLVQCTYDIEQQETVIARMVAELLEQFDDLPTFETDHNADCYELARVFAGELSRVAPRMKDPAFAEEREWRVVSPPSLYYNSDEKYRVGRSFIVPYLEFKLPATDSGQLAIDTVLVGPTPHLRLSASAITPMLRRRNVAIRNVLYSRVPYRSW